MPETRSPEHREATPLSCTAIIQTKLEALQREEQELREQAEKLPQLKEGLEAMKAEYDTLPQRDFEARGTKHGQIHTAELQIQDIERGGLKRVEAQRQAVENLQQLAESWEQGGQTEIPLLRRFIGSETVPYSRDALVEYLTLVLDNADNSNKPEVFARDLKELRKARKAWVTGDENGIKSRAGSEAGTLEVFGDKSGKPEHIDTQTYIDNVRDFGYALYTMLKTEPSGLNHLRVNTRANVSGLLDQVNS